MKPIKVCHIVNLITGKADGVYTHLKMIFKNYDKDKFEHYLIFQGGDKVEKEIKGLGIKVYSINSLKNKFSLKAFPEIYRILKENQIEIIHTHLVKPYIICGTLNIFLRKKFIFNYNGLFIHQNIYYGVAEKLIYQFIHFIINVFGTVDSVLVPSIKSKELMIRETKLFPEPVVYYNGYSHLNNLTTELSIVERIMKIKTQGNIIVIVARLEIQKRLDVALGLFNSLLERKKSLYLLIFGDGDLKNDLIKITREYGIESQVIFFDYVPNVVAYYKFFDIVLFTSDWEGMPLTMWEAMANEVPVVAPDVGGFKEILEENKCGLIYDSGNLKDAEHKLILLLEDVQLRKRMGINAREAIESNYTEKKFIQQIEKVYTSLMAE